MDDLIRRQDAIDEFWSLDAELKPSAIDAILNMLNGLPSAQQWTPCSEGAPKEDGGWYLVTDYSKSINRRRMHVSRCYVNNGGFWSDVPLGYKVVAWMPLPEPYTERRTDDRLEM